ncbi:MAG: DNA gyrase C-terminal beta-propeller domain-containing protein, partial [Gammaproteobacteria bacterium]|nr:DNA gyrase C-terminal beta-propeller domain-containing protein [Gammaproteobacteria bacterium]
RQGTGFCFERSTLKEPSARTGRILIRLRSGDEVIAVRPVQRPLLAIATNRRVLLTPMSQVNVLAGAGRGIKLIKPDPPGVLDFFTVSNSPNYVKNSSGCQSVYGNMFLKLFVKKRNV